ncbi:hypothetical protein SDJN03_27393, partial [Cucurbita argyrosperma subsp. sororia]
MGEGALYLPCSIWEFSFRRRREKPAEVPEGNAKEMELRDEKRGEAARLTRRGEWKGQEKEVGRGKCLRNGMTKRKGAQLLSEDRSLLFKLFNPVR